MQGTRDVIRRLGWARGVSRGTRSSLLAFLVLVCGGPIIAQAETPVRIIEVPTIPGMFPGMFAGSIDEGMRGGIPSEDWGSVVTVYGDGAGEIKRWTGAGDRNGRVMLLDAEGVVRWFHDEGYSAGKLTELDAALRELK